MNSTETQPRHSVQRLVSELTRVSKLANETRHSMAHNEDVWSNLRDAAFNVSVALEDAKIAAIKLANTKVRRADQ